MFYLILVSLMANGHLQTTMQDFDLSSSCNEAIKVIRQTYAAEKDEAEIKLLVCIRK